MIADDDQPTGAFALEVRLAVDNLVFAQAHAIWLVDVCGCSYQQAAREMKTSHPAVAKNVRRGRTTVLKALNANI